MNPSFETMRAEAVRLLADKGVPHWTTVPAIYRFIWTRGIKLRPPHFASWEANFALSGGTAGGIAAVGTWLAITAAGGEMALFLSLVWGLCATVTYGWSAAARYKREAEDHGLPQWDELAVAADLD